MRIRVTSALIGAGAALQAAAGASAGVETEPSEDRVRAIVSEMLADAESRSSLLQNSSNAGHDGHFFLSDGDAFRLQVEGQIQFRYMATFSDQDDDVDGSQDFESGFTNTRTELAFSGHVYDPSLLYKISANFDEDGGEFTLEDAWAGKAFENGLIVIAGQYREPILWEDVINDHHALAVDQSIVNAVFRQDRSQGAWVHYQAEAWRVWAGFSDGIRSENTDFTSDPADWGLTSRFEWKADGAWNQFDSFSSAPGSEFGLKVGAGIHWQDGPHDSGSPELELGAWTADVMLQGDGWNAFAMGVGLYTQPAGGPTNTDWGFLVQGGFFLPETDWELFGRYDVVLPDSDRDADDAFNTITVGANYYLHGQAAKFTVDAQYLVDDTEGNALLSDPGLSDRLTRIGVLPTSDDGQVVLRFQFQLLF